MKKIFFNLVLICAVSVAFATPPINEQVMKQFKAAFPAVEDARWFESESHYDVYFEKEETKYHIRYDRNGKIVSTRNYYPGTKLCPFIKSKVTEKFGGKSIFGVTEITTSNEMFYVVVLEDEDTWTNVQADAMGQLTVLSKLKKAK
jgi:hypothetical protein